MSPEDQERMEKLIAKFLDGLFAFATWFYNLTWQGWLVLVIAPALLVISLILYFTLPPSTLYVTGWTIMDLFE
jgi:hypothetical protein